MFRSRILSSINLWRRQRQWKLCFSCFTIISLLATTMVQQHRPGCVAVVAAWTTSTISQRESLHSLGLQLSPLIGGPSWLPLHVKVVLVQEEETMVVASEDHNTAKPLSTSAAAAAAFQSSPPPPPPAIYKHEWDFVPVNATSPHTLQQLLRFQHVPGQVRYRRCVVGVNGDAEHHGSGANGHATTTSSRAAHIVVASSLLFGDRSKHSNDHNNGNSEYDQSLPATAAAIAFCQSYQPLELHLLTNNCWTFALRMMLSLWSLQPSNSEYNNRNFDL
jgi:hypothetical protein